MPTEPSREDRLFEMLQAEYATYTKHRIQAAGLLDEANCDGDHPCEDGDDCECNGQHDCECKPSDAARVEAHTHALVAQSAASVMAAVAALLTSKPTA